MAKYLVIVESPAKVKTIKKFLGANYDVEASNGHVRDFPKSQFGIDVENDFEPKYITIRGKGELLAKLLSRHQKKSKPVGTNDYSSENQFCQILLKQEMNLQVLSIPAEKQRFLQLPTRKESEEDTRQSATLSEIYCFLPHSAK